MRIAYRTLGFLIAALVAVQAASHAWSSAGLGLYVAEGHTVDSSLLESPTLPFPEALGFMIHGLNGMYIIPAVALALLVVSFFVHLRGAVLFAAITLGLVAIQVTLGLLGHGLPTLGLLHGLNAILLVCSALYTQSLAAPSRAVAATASTARTAQTRVYA